MSSDQPQTTANPRDAAACARTDYGDKSPLWVAQAIGSFADDPADSRFQRSYLAELWNILREKMPK